MSKADEMFEKLGYHLIIPRSSGDNYIEYHYHDEWHSYIIEFDLESETIRAFSDINENDDVPIDKKLLEAINEKVRELEL